MTSYQARACKWRSTNCLSRWSYWNSSLLVVFDRVYPEHFLRFCPEQKGSQVAVFLAPLLLWKWFLLFILSCEGKWSVIDCNSRLKAMFVCHLLLKVCNAAAICSRITSMMGQSVCGTTAWTDTCTPPLNSKACHFNIFINNLVIIWTDYCFSIHQLLWFWLA